MKMKALVKERPGPGLSLLDIDLPHVERADDVQFKVEYCAICVGEMKVYDWDDWAANDATLQLPTVLGHEVAGVVTAVGPEVIRFRPVQVQAAAVEPDQTRPAASTCTMTGSLPPSAWSEDPWW